MKEKFMSKRYKVLLSEIYNAVLNQKTTQYYEWDTQYVASASTDTSDDEYGEKRQHEGNKGGIGDIDVHLSEDDDNGDDDDGTHRSIEVEPHRNPPREKRQPVRYGGD